MICVDSGSLGREEEKETFKGTISASPVLVTRGRLDVGPAGRS